MKKFLLTAATAAAALTAFSADKFYVIMKDGSVESYPTEKVDSISFNDPQIEKIMGFGDMMQEIAKLKEEIAALKAGSGVQDTSVSDLRYNIISDTEAEVVGFNTGTPNLVVPEKVTLFGKEYTVTRFSASAFYNSADTSSIYSFVKTVVLPKSIKSIAENVFGGLKEVTSYSVDPENPYYSSLDGILYDKNKTKIIKSAKKLTGVIELPSTLTSIETRQFQGGSFISLVIPSSVTSIGREPFYGCSGQIFIPSSIKELDLYGVFGGCENVDLVVDNLREDVAFTFWGEEKSLERAAEYFKSVTFKDGFKLVKSIKSVDAVEGMTYTAKKQSLDLNFKFTIKKRSLENDYVNIEIEGKEFSLSLRDKQQFLVWNPYEKSFEVGSLEDMEDLDLVVMCLDYKMRIASASEMLDVSETTFEALE